MGICDGWTVVEMGAGSVATALAGMMLADNGARVLELGYDADAVDRLKATNVVAGLAP